MEEKKEFIGFKVCSGTDNAYSFELCETKEEAEAIEKEEVTQLIIMRKGCKVWTEKVLLNRCRCGRLKEIEDIECLNCDHVRADTYQIAKELTADMEITS